jgi:hypothetical protein
MSRHTPRKREEEEEPASAEVSRLLVIGFLIAAGLGLLAGLVWIAWNLLGGRVPN